MRRQERTNSVAFFILNNLLEPSTQRTKRPAQEVIAIIEVGPLEESMRHSDGVMRLNLDIFMGNCLVSYDELEHLSQDISEDAPNNDYICLIQIHSLGGPSVALRVNHLSKLPPYLENFILNHKIKKLAVDVGRICRAMYVSYKLP